MSSPVSAASSVSSRSSQASSSMRRARIRPRMPANGARDRPSRSRSRRRGWGSASETASTSSTGSPRPSRLARRPRARWQRDQQSGESEDRHQDDRLGRIHLVVASVMGGRRAYRSISRTRPSSRSRSLDRTIRAVALPLPVAVASDGSCGTGRRSRRCRGAAPLLRTVRILQDRGASRPRRGVVVSHPSRR